MSVKAMKSGAVEFLTNHSGNRICSVRFSDRSRSQIASSGKTADTAELQQRYNTLSVREREVMSLVSDANKQLPLSSIQ